MANAGFATETRNSVSAQPKEIGYLQRVEGVSSGLTEIVARLQSFSARVNGDAMLEGAPVPSPGGMHGYLSTSEDHIRECLGMLSKLENSF